MQLSNMLGKLVRYFLSLAFLFFLLGGLGFWSAYNYLDEELPSYKHLKNYDPPLVTRLYAQNGQMLEEYALEHRSFIPIEYVPKNLIQGFLAAEDKNFYTHKGVDYLGIIKAIIRNLSSLGTKKRPMGASSITQQVAKNFLLSGELSIKRKLKEAMLAWKLEKTFSKEKILELYLNEIYLGAGAYGIAAAALHYFDKALQDLTLGEIAYLAGLPKAPNSYSLYRNPEKAKNRRDWVLGRMLVNGIITQTDYEIALKEPLKGKKHKKKKTLRSGYFSEHIRQELVKDYGEDALYKGGLVVKTTLDPKYQMWAEEALRKGLIAYDRRYGYRGVLGKISIDKENEALWCEDLNKVKDPKGLDPYELAVVLGVNAEEVIIGTKNGEKGSIPLKFLKWAKKQYKSKEGYPTVGRAPKSPEEVVKLGNIILVEKTKKKHIYKLAQIPLVQGAIVVMDPHTGRILALSGGYSFARSKYNRAIQANRQTGSAFKVFVFLAGLEEGYSPITRILDEPIEIDLGPELGTWAPNNMSMKFYGPVTFRKALEKSYNVSTVQLTKKLGLKKIARLTKRFGVEDNLKPQWSVALGADETTLLKMVTGFSQVANGGKKVRPIFIDRVQNRRGKTLKINSLMDCEGCLRRESSSLILPSLKDRREVLIDPRHAYQMTSMLQSAMEKGTGRRANIKPYALAGKTGSTNNFRDAWFLGYSPDLVVGVYVGFDAPRSLGNFETGARAAAPIFKDFMSKALKESPPAPFRTPPGLVFKKVNPITGLPPESKDPVRVEGLIPNDKGEVIFDSIPIGSEEEKMKETDSFEERRVNLFPEVMENKIRQIKSESKLNVSKKEKVIIDPWVARI